MKPKTLILILAAVGCGLAASYLTSKWLAGQNKDQAVEEEKVPVVVARQKVAIGTLLKNPEQYFVVKEFSPSQAPSKALKKLDDLKDKRLNTSLSTDQFVSNEHLLDSSKSGELAASLPPGMRGVAIRANSETSGGGFVLVGSRVDLIVTVKKGDQDSWARTVLQNMLVLGVDQMQVREEEKRHHVPSVVTLAATPEDAELVKMMQAMGEISLILRSPDDDKVVHTRGSKPRDVEKARHGAGAGTPDTETPEAALAAKLGGIPFPDVKPQPVQPTQPEQPKDEPPPLKTFTQWIENGANLSKQVYVIDHKGEVTAPDIEKQELSPRPERVAPRPENGPQVPPQGAPTGQPSNGPRRP